MAPCVRRGCGGGGGSVCLGPSSASAPVQLPPPPTPVELPDPETVRRQKDQHAKNLEEQLQQAVEQLGEQHRQHTELLHATANQEKHRYNLAMDQKVKQQELFLSQQYNEQLMRLQQAAQAQRAGLEKQACSLILEYQQKKVQEEFVAQQVGIQRQHWDAQVKLSEEIQKLGPSSDASFVRELKELPKLGLPPVASYASPPLAANVPMPMGTMMAYVPPGGVAPGGPPPGGSPAGQCFSPSPRPQRSSTPMESARGQLQQGHGAWQGPSRGARIVYAPPPV